MATEPQPITDWTGSWHQGRTPWDLRGITPPLQALADSGYLGRLELPDRSVAVPGCGRGHDLRLFAAQGFRVVGFDIVPHAVQEARRLLRLNGVSAGVQVLCRDVLGLGDEHRGAFGLVYDYTCFCALPLPFRRAYAQAVRALLRPGGVLLQLGFPMMPARDPHKGPPFRMLEPDLRSAFGPDFELLERQPARASVPERRGCEEWFVWRTAPIASGS